MPSSSADALLFDLGRVVIDIDFNRASPDGPSMLVVIKSSLENDFGTTTPRTNGLELRSARRSSLTIFEHHSRLIFRTRNCLTGGTPSLSERCPASPNCWPRRREAFRCTPLPIPTANTSSTGQSSFPAFSAISKRSTCRRQLGCESPKPRRTTMLSGQSAYRQTVLCSLTIAVKTLREHEPGDCRLFT